MATDPAEEYGSPIVEAAPEYVATEETAFEAVATDEDVIAAEAITEESIPEVEQYTDEPAISVEESYDPYATREYSAAPQHPDDVREATPFEPRDRKHRRAGHALRYSPR